MDVFWQREGYHVLITSTEQVRKLVEMTTRQRLRFDCVEHNQIADAIMKEQMLPLPSYLQVGVCSCRLLTITRRAPSCDALLAYWLAGWHAPSLGGCTHSLSHSTCGGDLFWFVLALRVGGRAYKHTMLASLSFTLAALVPPVLGTHFRTLCMPPPPAGVR